MDDGCLRDNRSHQVLFLFSVFTFPPTNGFGGSCGVRPPALSSRNRSQYGFRLLHLTLTVSYCQRSLFSTRPGSKMAAISRSGQRKYSVSFATQRHGPKTRQVVLTLSYHPSLSAAIWLPSFAGFVSHSRYIARPHG